MWEKDPQGKRSRTKLSSQTDKWGSLLDPYYKYIEDKTLLK